LITWEMVKNRWNRDKVYTRPEFWNETAAEHYSEKGTLSWKNEHLNDILQRVECGIVDNWLGDINGKDILDLGCGGGRFSREFASRGARVHGIDFSEKSIEIARRITKSGDVRFTVASIFDLDEKDAYDFVVVSKVVTIACTNSDELRSAFAKIRDALRPGGRVIFVEPLHTSFLRRVLRMSLPEFVTVLKKAGFDVIETKGAEFAPVRLALAFFAWPSWITYPAFNTGETVLKIIPRLADQKFIFAARPAQNK
jgi:2-polyprenyl-3-methyl-5-hydroxy-6-metoxy-1,4-benzoquinol methylase